MTVKITRLSLAEELTDRWKLDEDRTIRALNILIRSGHPILQARKDENGNPITPTPALWIVRPSNGKGFYFVKPKQHFCSCKDNSVKNVCKHRRAVWIFSEQIKRQDEAVTGSAQNVKSVQKTFSDPSLLPFVEDEIITELGFDIRHES